MNQHVREMFLIPKETFLNCMNSASTFQREKIKDINVDQINVSCGPLFAGLKASNSKPESQKTLHDDSPNKKEITRSKFGVKKSAEKSDTSIESNKSTSSPQKTPASDINELPNRVIAPQKNSVTKINALTGKMLNDRPSDKGQVNPPFLPQKAIDSSISTLKPKNKPQKNKELIDQSAEQTIMQKIMGNNEDKQPESEKKSRKLSSSPEKSILQKSFNPPDLELEPQFASDFARTLSNKNSRNPEIRLNSTMLDDSPNKKRSNSAKSISENDDDVFLMDTRDLASNSSESAIQSELSKQDAVKNLNKLFNSKGFLNNPKSAEDEINTSIEKTMASKNRQELDEIERSRSIGSNPIRVSNLANKFGEIHSSARKPRKQVKSLTSKTSDDFYGAKTNSPAKRKTRFEQAKEAHEKRKNKLALGINVPLLDSPKRKRYTHQL